MIFSRQVKFHLYILFGLISFWNYSLASAIQNDSIAYESPDSVQTILDKAQSLVASYQFDKAITEYEELIKYYDSLSDYKSAGQARLELAYVFIDLDNRTEAIRLGQEAYDLFLIVADSLSLYNSLSVIAFSHDYLGNEIAIQYYEECIVLAEQLGLDYGVARMLKNLGGVYAEEGQYQRALTYYNKALKVGENVGDPGLLSGISQGFYLTYKSMENFVSAKSHLEEELWYSRLSKNERNLAFAYQDFASYYYAVGKYDSAIVFSNEALELASKLHVAQIIMNSYEQLNMSYYAIEDYKNAYNYFLKAKAMDDSLYNISKVKVIEKLRHEFESERKERAIAEKNLQLEIADLKIKKQEYFQVVLIVFTSLLIFLALVIYRSYRIRKRSNELLLLKNKEIAEQKDRVEIANEAKTRWFTNVAHELRTPLTLISGPLQKVLEEEPLSFQATKDLNLVSRSTDRLVKMVNEILDLSKLEDGQMKLECHKLSVKALIRNTIDHFEVLAEEKQVALVNDAEESNLILYADLEKLRKVLYNLISNALRFTPKGGKITVSVEVDEAIAIRVIDTGAGIAEKDLPFVFDRFYQANERKNAGGTGIGLALCQEIAELHGGEMHVSSQKDQGACFTLILPINRVSDDTKEIQVQEVEKIEEVERAALKIIFDHKPRLLIVEDNEDMREYLIRLLEPYFELFYAENGMMAVKSLEIQDIEMIVSDVMMPEMDGMEFSRLVKQHSEWRFIPFIHLSALNNADDRKTALRIGVDDYLQKPFDPEELIIRLQNLYQNLQSRKKVLLEEAEADDGVVNKKDDQLLRKLHDEVLKNITDSGFNVLRLADCAAMSERQIYRYIKGATGLTPLQFIQEIKLKYAMKIARKGTYDSVSEVASAVGFQNPGYFSNLFYRRFGKRLSHYLRAS